jgi:hypothetical protein
MPSLAPSGGVGFRCGDTPIALSDQQGTLICWIVDPAMFIQMHGCLEDLAAAIAWRMKVMFRVMAIMVVSLTSTFCDPEGCLGHGSQRDCRCSKQPDPVQPGAQPVSARLGYSLGSYRN